jgi:hypothetical protein
MKMGWTDAGPEDFILDSFVAKMDTKGLGYTDVQGTSVPECANRVELPTTTMATAGPPVCDNLIQLD